MNAKSNLFAAFFALLLSTVAIGSAVLPAQVGPAPAAGATLRA